MICKENIVYLNNSKSLKKIFRDRLKEDYIVGVFIGHWFIFCKNI